MSWLLDLRRAASGLEPELVDLPHLREAAIGTWRGRMVNEYRSALVFAHLNQQAAKVGLAESWREELQGFEAEERRHGVLCGAVVEALGGQASASVASSRPVPAHADVSPLEGLVRNVLSISCLSETVAVALIGAERLEMPEGELRQLLSQIWADEVGHARFGWRLLQELAPALSLGERQRLSLYLRVALRHLELHELAHLPLSSNPPPEGAALGLCSGADARTLFYETVEQAILPSLEGMGLTAREAWVERHAADKWLGA